MRKLEIFQGDYRKLVYMPDDAEVILNENGIVFQSFDPGGMPIVVLWLTYNWSYVWIDRLAKQI